MELIDYLRMVARRWRWVVGFALLGWIVGAVWATLTPRVYEVSALVFVGNSGAAGSGGETQDDLSASRFTLERMDSYAALVDSPDVTRAVKEELGLAAEPDEIASVLSAEVLENTVVLSVTAQSNQPAGAANIANEAAARLGAVIELVEAPGTGAASPINATVTRPASAPDSPASPDVRLALALGLVAGAGLGLLAAALREQAEGGSTDRVVTRRRRLRPADDRPADDRPADDRPADDQSAAARADEDRPLLQRRRADSADRVVQDDDVRTAPRT